MSKHNAIISMQQAIKDYIRRNLPEDKNRAAFGRVQDNRVIIRNVSYPFVPTVDMYFGNGDSVACLLPNSGNIAAIVGKF